MRLITADELEQLPLTRAYLLQHEAELRARDRAKMDRDGWWAFSRTQSLALHALPKLGVAATVKRLEVAADLRGAAYFHNVRVNGILPRDGGPQLPELTAVLNSRVVDFAFRRGAAPLQNGFFMANKQFIAWLPVPASIPPELGDWGARLYELVAAIEAERTGFLSWLASVIGARPRDLAGSEALANFAHTGLEGVLDVLDKNAESLSVDPRRRTERERIGGELAASVTKIDELGVQREKLERRVDIALYDAYGLTQEQQRRVDSEYR
jgi:hypothetical protein